MITKLVIDSNSLIDLFRYYEKIQQFEIIKEFLLEEVKNKNIIVIDKIYNELNSFQGKNSALNKLGLEEKHITKTEYLLPSLMQKANEWYNKDNEQQPKYRQNVDLIEIDKRDFFEKSADLYLIMICLELGENVMLITEETPNTRFDTKLYPKIPIICKKENIQYGKITTMLFEIYKNKFEIKVSIKEKQSL